MEVTMNATQRAEEKAAHAYYLKVKSGKITPAMQAANTARIQALCKVTSVSTMSSNKAPVLLAVLNQLKAGNAEPEVIASVNAKLQAAII